MNYNPSNYPSKYLQASGFTETHWKGVHAAHHEDYKMNEPPLLKVYVAAQHRQPHRKSYT